MPNVEYRRLFVHYSIFKIRYSLFNHLWGVPADSGRAFRYKSSLRCGLFTAIPNAICLNRRLNWFWDYADCSKSFPSLFSSSADKLHLCAKARAAKKPICWLDFLLLLCHRQKGAAFLSTYKNKHLRKTSSFSGNERLKRQITNFVIVSRSGLIVDANNFTYIAHF